MEDSESEAVDTLQSILGGETSLRIEGASERIIVSNQETEAMWFFQPIRVGRVDRNRVAHQVNKIEGLTSEAPDGSAHKEDPLLISDYVTAGAGEFLRREGISYLDASGNCFIRSGSLLLFVQGQKPKNHSRREAIRAFNSAGLKLIFAMLVREDLVNWTYRDLAKRVDIFQGAVAYVMRD